MFKKIQNAIQRMSSKTTEAEEEYIQYAQEVEHTLCLLEKHLHDSDDSAEILQNTLKTACDFYQGDWVGFLEMDLELGLWTPNVWYKADDDDQTKVLLKEFESSEFLPRWIDAMRNNDAIYIQNIDNLKDATPEELKLYEHLEIKSLLAVPVKPRPTGFLVVRNPQRYAARSSMLQMLGFVLLSALNEQNLIRSLRMMKRI